MKKSATQKRGTFFQEIFEKVSAQEWLEFANAQRAKLVKEVEQLGKEIIVKITDVPIFAHREQLIREARQSIEGLIQRLNQSDLLTKVNKVIDAARHGKYDLLHFLNIPSKQDLTKLERKLSKLESRVEHLGEGPTHHHPPHT